MKTFEVRSKVHDYTDACDRKVLSSQFAALGKVQVNISDLARDRIGPTRLGTPDTHKKRDPHQNSREIRF